MKRINTLLACFGLAVMTVASCKKDKIADVVPIDLSVTLAFDADNTSYGFNRSNAEVKITNQTTSQIYTAKTDANGKAVFSRITPGSYAVVASLTITVEEYQGKTGNATNTALIFNVSSSETVTANKDLSLSLKSGRIGDFLIKQIYYAGSSAANGAVFRDQFVEIYNNSNETLYADSLYFGQVEAVATIKTRIDFTKGYFLPSGVWDWSKSVGMSNVNANTGYIYAKTLYMLPGTGKQYPVEPGKSIIIAQNALNHQSPYTGADGKTISVKDPSLTIDLSKADFEVYIGKEPGINPLASDVDNPAIANLVVIDHGGNRDLILDNPGREGLFIFKTRENVKNWQAFPTPDVTQVTSSTSKHIQIPLSVVADGVGLQHTIAASRVPKLMPDALDAGEIFVTGGSYSSQSVVRKTARTVSGRVVLKDSNNSANDFGVLGKADPSKSASSFIN